MLTSRIIKDKKFNINNYLYDNINRQLSRDNLNTVKYANM